MQTDVLLDPIQTSIASWLDDVDGLQLAVLVGSSTHALMKI